LNVESFIEIVNELASGNKRIYISLNLTQQRITYIFTKLKELGLIVSKTDDPGSQIVINSSKTTEKLFLKNYTIPFVQLDSMKSILVFSHEHNSFDKKKLLDNINKYVTISEKKPEDFIKEEDILQFFMNDIDPLLKEYEPGDPKYKPDVLKQIKENIENPIHK
jgi:hypothetical protein